MLKYSELKIFLHVKYIFRFYNGLCSLHYIYQAQNFLLGQKRRLDFLLPKSTVARTRNYGFYKNIARERKMVVK